MFIRSDSSVVPLLPQISAALDGLLDLHQWAGCFRQLSLTRHLAKA